MYSLFAQVGEKEREVQLLKDQIDKIQNDERNEQKLQLCRVCDAQLSQLHSRIEHCLLLRDLFK